MSRVPCVLLLFCLALPTAFATPVPPGQLTSALHWRNVGPYSGGRVTTVAGIAAQPNVYYMGTASGGVWESKDYGDSWKNISDKYFKNSDIGALAVSPSNPKTIYAGTGDSDPRNTIMTGEGLYKSIDGGNTWTYIGLGETHIISWILVDPRNPDVVYVAALGHLFAPNPERGVFKTTDGGKTWKRILYVNDGTGAISMTMDPADPSVVYAAMWQMSRAPWTFSSGGAGSGIYRTTDGGSTWTNISHRPALPTGIFGKVGIALAPSRPNVVYALIQANYKGQKGGLFRSDDAGQSWRLVNDSMDITQRSFYFMHLYVDPKDPDTIYVLNTGLYVSHNAGEKLIALQPPHSDNQALWINPNNPKLFIEGNDGGATVTQNGGKAWSPESNQPTGQIYHANLDDQFPFHIYGSQQDQNSIEGPSTVLVGDIIPPIWRVLQGAENSWVVPTPGRPWVTYTNGHDSLEWKYNRRTGLITNVSPWPSYKLGYAGDRIGYRFNWSHHNVVFAHGSPEELLDGANVLFESTDEGFRWKVISPDLTRNDRSKLRRPGGPISADVSGEETFDTISAIAPSPLTHNVIWTGSDDGLVYVTADGGGHWSQVRPPMLPTWSKISCIEASYADEGTAYVSASRYMWDDFHPYVYKTTDYGKHWTEITSGLPQGQYIESVRQDPSEPNLLFAGGSETAYFSLDGGQQWQPLTLNLPAVRVNDVEIQPEQHAVVLATFGRGFWVQDDLQFLEQLATARVRSEASYLFKPQQAWLVTRSPNLMSLAMPAPVTPWWLRKPGGHIYPGMPLMGGENSAPGVTVLLHLPADYHGSKPAVLSFTTASGELIRSFTLHMNAQGKPKPHSQLPGGAQKRAEERLTAIEPGMNHFQWDLRYPNAVDVKGIFYASMGPAAPMGPQVVPGTYYVTLTYDDVTQKQPFVVKLDPTSQTTQAQLQQRFELLMRIRDALNRLDGGLNQAIEARDALQKAVTNSGIASNRAQPALDRLNRDIDHLVDLKIRSSEGGLVYPPRLRSWLTSIAAQVGEALVQPTPSMVQVADEYIHDADAAVPRLKSDVAAAREVLNH